MSDSVPSLDVVLARAARAPLALSEGDLARLLNVEAPQELEALFAAAYALKLKCCGKGVAVRGLVEAGNICAKDCLYTQASVSRC